MGGQFKLDSEFARYEFLAGVALAELEEFWSRVYGPNEALAPAFECLEGMVETWQGTPDLASRIGAYTMREGN